ncbi:MAG: DUF1318 domain-containing protein [Verrucomicrobiales bacterium]|jgi:hypothetical protein|nr:DUF1318 domain-containing protein [Verrucomicrobiales bacterium]MBP9224599.1 DUF1318 domain-containing protein [Verrucomicrobiales bacterium]
MQTQNHRFFRHDRAELASGALVAFLALSMTSCLKPFDVNVATPAPIKVDLSMDVHVYQHGATDTKKSETQAEFRSAMDSRRDRMSEIQELKNNRLVGENHDGTLTVKTRPAGEYGDYVEKTVKDENLDRETLMKQEAEEKNTEVSTIRDEQWRHWQRKSFPGEWIEIANEGGQGYRWVQKEAVGEGD